MYNMYIVYVQYLVLEITVSFFVVHPAHLLFRTFMEVTGHGHSSLFSAIS